MLPKLQYAIFLTFIDALNIVHSNVKIEKCLCIRCVCLSASIRYNSRKYSSNVLKIISVIHIEYSMNRIENNLYRTNDVYRNAQKYSDTLRHLGENL